MSMAGPQEPPLDNEEYRKIIKIVKNYVGERLRKKNLYVPGYDDTEDLNSIANIAETLRRVGDELEAADSQFFAHMCTQLQITTNTAYPMFQGIADEIFASGKNWGRIVAFLTFGSTLAVHCAARQDMGFSYVDTVVQWIYKYMISHLDYWMTQHGGWQGFLDFFDAGENRRDGSNQNGFIVSAIAGVGIGALLMMTFK